jgi:hypothetical protein
MVECPVNEQWDHWTPCPVCGALGPWFDSGDCVRPVDVDDELHQILGEALHALPSEESK